MTSTSRRASGLLLSVTLVSILALQASGFARAIHWNPVWQDIRLAESSLGGGSGQWGQWSVELRHYLVEKGDLPSGRGWQLTTGN